MPYSIVDPRHNQGPLISERFGATTEIPALLDGDYQICLGNVLQ